MKVLFLDIDGVLNNAKWYKARFEKAESKNNISLIYALDPDNIDILNQIISRVTDLNIVISSTWRLGKDIGELRNVLSESGFKYSKQVIDKTPYYPGKERGEEIQAWIDANGPIGNFVIVDDDSDMCSLIKNLVKTDNMVGLTEECIPQILSLLGQ